MENLDLTQSDLARFVHQLDPSWDPSSLARQPLEDLQVLLLQLEPKISPAQLREWASLIEHRRRLQQQTRREATVQEYRQRRLEEQRKIEAALAERKREKSEQMAHRAAVTRFGELEPYLARLLEQPLRISVRDWHGSMTQPLYGNIYPVTIHTYDPARALIDVSVYGSGQHRLFQDAQRPFWFRKGSRGASTYELNLEPLLTEAERADWPGRHPLYAAAFSVVMPPDLARYLLKAV